MKQETLEEVAERLYPNGCDGTNRGVKIYRRGFTEGAKWQQERSYSEEDMKSFGDWCRNGLLNTEYSCYKLDKHLEQWKQLTSKENETNS